MEKLIITRDNGEIKINGNQISSDWAGCVWEINLFPGQTGAVVANGFSVSIEAVRNGQMVKTGVVQINPNEPAGTIHAAVLLLRADILRLRSALKAIALRDKWEIIIPQD